MYRPSLPCALLLLLSIGCTDPGSKPDAEGTVVLQADSTSIASWNLSLQHTLQEIERLQSESMTQAEMNHTAFLELEVLEAELFMTMARYEAHCSPDDRAALLSDHVAWLKRRDTAAALERSEHAGGTIAPLIEATEMSQWTRYRIGAIAALSARGEGCELPRKDRVDWRVTDEGLMDGDDVILDGSTPFSIEVIRGVLPAGTISDGVHEDEGGTRPIFVLSNGLDFMGRIYGAEDGTIEILEVDLAGVEGPEGGMIGWPMEYLSPARLDCVPGLEHLSGHAVCHDGNHPSITYVFRSDNWTGPDGSLPEAAELESWTLWTLFWTHPNNL